jgi:23S rRNA (uracil1939-C5)-methyltransferase
MVYRHKCNFAIVKYGQILTNQRVCEAVSEGFGLVRPENAKVILVAGAIPGDVIDLKLIREHRNYREAVIERIITPSADRIVPGCVHFGVCGGCKWQQAAYAMQLKYKQKQVTDAFHRIAALRELPILPIVGCEDPWHYRNKLEFNFSARRWLLPAEMTPTDNFNTDSTTGNNENIEEQKLQKIQAGALGFHISGAFDKVLHINECWLGLPVINQIRNAIFSFAQQHSISFYNLKNHTGILRTLIFRNAIATGELMVYLIVSNTNEPPVALFEHILQLFPQITTLVWSVNDKLNSSYADLPWQVYFGSGYITEKIGKFSFRIAPTSFFQTNTRQAQRLYELVYAALPEKEIDMLFDLYCGAGSIGIFVSEKAKRIIGVEYSASAVRDATENVRINQLHHLEFYAGDIYKLLQPQWLSQFPVPEVIIVDPPRAGLEQKLPERLLQIGAARIIYVSCNPATQARDLQVLSRQYRIKSIQPVDMFPHTAHVENIIVLDKIYN